MRIVRLYVRLLGAHLRSLLEYEGDFWIMMAGTLVMQVVNVVFLSAIFAKVPAINGWTFWAVVAMFGMVAVAEGVGSLFFEGMWSLSWQINQGEIDYKLVRPYPVVLQVSSTSIGIHGLTNIVTGGLMLGFAVFHLSVPWTPLRILLALVILLSAIAVKVAVNLATNSAAFWMQSPSPLFAMAVHQAGDLARFPLSVYPWALRAALGFALPFAFVSFFPVAFLLGSGQAWVGLLTPLVAAYSVLVAAWIFNRGLRRYESAGN
ncbi:ABC transporter permease [Dactylosporangium matsuzakiense]|uniref:Multidrug ABC transporter permease n=1 Tax=Dactylosporangium matsuzakiense TaxID=53360 RepID=A0A9W6KN04_9ACTN|nr:ABC-2 family transporter protein [Dactylosporangium matsuzakiense]UWZ42643.1 ABC-2 family transporter protein [Dactylosporangium matsuzakiense]GLL03885.1 multidrug ABC transporter permease [Dactylosporangium matsuzakiense]